MRREQRKFNTEMDAWKIMGKLYTEQFEGCGRQFTMRTFCVAFSWYHPGTYDHDYHRARLALVWLSDREYVFQCGGGAGTHFKKTDAGEYAYESQRAVPFDDGNKFRNECLTGATATCQPSRLKYNPDLTRSDLEPVLPSRGGTPAARDPESRLESFLGLSQLAEQFGVTKDQAARMLESGEIHVCKNGEPHLGRFHRKGDRWQNLCTVCAKKVRK